LEWVLRARVAELDEITTSFGYTATGIIQRAMDTTVDFIERATGAQRRVRARFTVGCDGARSFIRDSVGIEQDIDPHDRRMVLLVFRSTELHRLLERYPGKSIYNTLKPELNGYWQFLGRVALDGTWFFHAPVPAETTADNFDFHRYLHEAIGAEFAIEFQHIGFWDLRIAVANTYRKGRVFIAGDAAHSHPPYGGFGVNNGFEDARNLSWKLAASFQGWAGKTLLDSYSSERRAVFASTSKDFIGRMIADDRTFCREFSPEKDLHAFQAAWAARARGGNKDVSQYLPNYAGSDLIWGPEGAISGATGQHLFKARAGHHLAPLPQSSGITVQDNFGPGFTLLNCGAAEGPAAEFRDAAQKHQIPLKILSVADRSVRNFYQADLVLVRPDTFIAWAGGELSETAENILLKSVGR
jgi:4-hydroxyisophthalate hydroxylase